MKSLSEIRTGVRGTIMVFALLVILGGALILAGWAQMLATRVAYPDTADDGGKRRIALANGRALAREFLLEQMPSGESVAREYFLSNNWGGFEFFSSRSNFWADTNLVDANPFNQFGERSFAVSNWCYLSGVGTNEEYWTFLVRSRSPLLAGYPLVVHNPSTSTNTNNNRSPNRIFGANIFTNTALYVGPVAPFTSGTNTNGYAGNFSAPMNTNYVALPGYTNLSYPNSNGLSYTNATNTGAVVTSSSLVGSVYTTNYNGGRLTVVLNPTDSNSFLRYDVPDPLITRVSFTNVILSKTYIYTYSNTTVTNLHIVGSALTNAMHVVATNRAALAAVTLVGNSNNRSLYISKSGGNLTLQTSGYTNGIWALGLSLSGACPLTVTPPASATLKIRGGLRTDGTITVSTGTLTNSLETGSSMDFIADRVLWLEQTRTQ